jgi:hypothetical protein
MSAGQSLVVTDYNSLRAHPLLAAAVSKVSWGHKHLKDLENSAEESLSRTECQARLSASFDVESGDHVFAIASVPDLAKYSEEIVNTVFDIAGNFRAALDKLAWALVQFEHGGTAPNPASVKFPICDSPEIWQKAQRARGQFATPHDAFIEEFQPYRGLNGLADSWHGTYVHPLAMVQSLNNEGKHQDDWPVMLPGAGASVGRNALPADFDMYLAEALQFKPMPLEGIGRPMAEGSDVMRLRLHAGADKYIDDAGRLTPILAFDDGRRIIDTLQRIERYVGYVLSEFARRFP